MNRTFQCRTFARLFWKWALRALTTHCRQCGIAGLVVQLIAAPVVAQERPFAQEPSGRMFQSQIPGKSFRHGFPGGSPSSGRESTGDSEAFSKGMALSESTLSGVTYQIHIVGEVQSPGTYRLTASDRLQEALQRAGGILERGSIRSVQIRRRGAGARTYDLLLFRLRGALVHNPYLLDNDVVYVPLRKNVIQILGAVQRPEIYELKSERTVAAALALAGGFSVGAAAGESVKIIRFIDGEKTILEVAQDQMSLRQTPVHDGDVLYVPDVITAKNQFDFNLSTLPGGQIFYPSYEDRVFVLGGVHTPGPYPFSPYYSVGQYVTLAGGTSKLARMRGVKLISTSGKAVTVRHLDAATVVNPGDTIYVPERRLQPESWVNVILAVASFGLSTTSVIYQITR